MSTYPYTIDNGHGEQLTFTGRGTKDGVESVRVTNNVGPGSGPPMHVHFLQHESLTVLQGVLSIQVEGKEPQLLYPGESAVFNKGTMHRFWNAGKEQLICEGEIWPVYNIEYFLTEIFKSTKASKAHRPDAFDAAWLLNRYGSEFDMGGLPAIVKKIIFPLALRIGKLKGKDKKFENAPAAI